MPIFKTVQIFRAGANGWSEVWYQDRSQLTDAIQPAKNVAGNRQGMCGTGVVLEYIRISSVTRPFKSHVFSVTLDWNTQAGVADTAWNTIFAKISDTQKIYHRVFQMRGVPDTWINRSATTNEFDISVTPAVDAVKNYVASLKQNGHMFRARDKTGAGATETSVTLFSSEAGSNRLKALLAIPGAAPGSQITFSGVTGPGAELARGRHTVRSNTGTEILFETILPASVVPPVWSNGKARQYIQIEVVPDTGVPLRTSHRDTGRRFFVTRGRRPKRRPFPSTLVV